MLLPFTDGLMRTTHFDPEMATLADRHYSRVRPGTRQFTPNGRKLILRNCEGTVLFAWMFDRDDYFRRDGQKGYYCSIFRNESARKSSEIILEAEEWVIKRWGPNSMFTYVNSNKIESPNPGYCFKCAGWKQVGFSKGGLILLAKENA